QQGAPQPGSLHPPEYLSQPVLIPALDYVLVLPLFIRDLSPAQRWIFCSCCEVPAVFLGNMFHPPERHAAFVVREISWRRAERNRAGFKFGPIRIRIEIGVIVVTQSAVALVLCRLQKLLNHLCFYQQRPG